MKPLPYFSHFLFSSFMSMSSTRIVYKLAPYEYLKNLIFLYHYDHIILCFYSRKLIFFFVILSQMLSDLLYRAPVDRIIKLLVEQRVPVFQYVMNTTVEALRLPYWRKYPHNIEHLFLTGAPFMDVGRF